jgi:CBS domain-containing protein
MKVKDIMTTRPAVCAPDVTAADAAHLMWDSDCGMLPIVDDGELVGVVTDRDMYIALATRNERAARLRVGSVANNTVWTCVADDDVHTALATMKQHRVRRLPVLGFGRTVVGVISMNDIVMAAGIDATVRDDEVVDVLKTICGHHHPVPHVITA